MNSILFLMTLAASPPGAGDSAVLPPGVVAFAEGRDVCEHFRGEPSVSTRLQSRLHATSPDWRNLARVSVPDGPGRGFRH